MTLPNICINDRLSQEYMDNNNLVNQLQSNDFEFELLVQTYLHDVNYSSKKEAIAKIAYSILNVGLVALPFAAYQGGLIIYIIGIIIVSIFSGYTTCMVINMANDHNVRTLEDLGEKAFGKWGFYLTSICQIVFSLSLLCITLNVWSEITLAVVQSYYLNSSYSFYFTNRKIHIFIGALIVLPLCAFTRSISTLKFIPYFTVLTIVGALVAVTIGFTNDILSDPDYKVNSDVLFPTIEGWVVSFVIPFCFSFNQKALTVYSCLRRRNSERWKYSVTRALIVVSCIYLIVGIFGYLSYSMRNSVLDSLNYFQSDSLTNQQTLYNIIRSIIALSLLLTFPVDCLIAATALRRLFRRYVHSTFGKHSSLCKTFIKPNYRRSSDLSRPRTLSVNSGKGNSTFMNFWGYFFGPITPNRPSDHSNMSNISSNKVDNFDSGWDFDPMNTNIGSKNDKIGNNNIVQINYSLLLDSDGNNRDSNKSKDLTTSSVYSASNSDELFSKFGNDHVIPNNPNNYDTTDTRSDTYTATIIPSYNLSQKSLYSIFMDCLPGLLFWGLGLSFCIGLNMWTAIAGSLGTFSTAFLVYILPSMMYFQLGLSTDYQAIPIPLIGIIPNYIYMTIIFLFGWLLLFGNMAMFVGFVLLEKSL